MAIHIYMSTKPGKAAGGAQMNYRGEVGPGDDPKAFKRRMEELGYVVVLTERRSDAEVVPEKREGRPQQAPHVRLSDLTMEVSP